MANEAWTTRGRSKYIGRPKITEIADGENQWTTPSYFATAYADRLANGVELSVSLDDSGTGSAESQGSLGDADATFAAVVTLQRSFDDGVTWHDVEHYTKPTQKTIPYENAGVKLRLGVKVGDYVSGRIALLLSQV